MRKKSKVEDLLNLELALNNKIKAIRNILDSLGQIFILLDPLLNKMLVMEEAKKYTKNGIFKKAIQLFSDISLQCKELGNPSIPPELLKNLRN